MVKSIHIHARTHTQLKQLKKTYTNAHAHIHIHIHINTLKHVHTRTSSITLLSTNAQPNEFRMVYLFCQLMTTVLNKSNSIKFPTYAPWSPSSVFTHSFERIDILEKKNKIIFQIFLLYDEIANSKQTNK